MSLATQCPHCHTTFRVANDQLKLQAGLVRCGVCQQVFNGIEQLLETSSEVKEKLTAANYDVQPVTSDLSPSPIVQIQEVEISTDDNHGNYNDKPEETDIEQLSFVQKANTQKSLNQRLKGLFAAGSVVLFLLLAGQLMYQFRDLIAATYPTTKKTLVTLCQYAHCQIQLPAQIDALSFEADALHTLPREHTFELNLLLRNRSALTQTWPHIELTLKNVQRQTVLRRVFTPAEYLSNPNQISDGFPANQEHAVNIFFELDQVMASDYAVAIFYP